MEISSEFFRKILPYDHVSAPGVDQHNRRLVRLSGSKFGDVDLRFCSLRPNLLSGRIRILNRLELLATNCGYAAAAHDDEANKQTQ